jgi:hypothetical protein
MKTGGNWEQKAAEIALEAAPEKICPKVDSPFVRQ